MIMSTSATTAAVGIFRISFLLFVIWLCDFALTVVVTERYSFVTYNGTRTNGRYGPGEYRRSSMKRTSELCKHGQGIGFQYTPGGTEDCTVGRLCRDCLKMNILSLDERSQPL